MNTSRRAFPFLLCCLLIQTSLNCIPSAADDVNEFEIRNSFIDSITTSKGDTMDARLPAFASAWYTTGTEDCRKYADSTLTQSDTTFRIAVQETVYTQRLCLQVAIPKRHTFLLANSLQPGKYFILANEHTDNMLRYEFVVAE